LFFLLFDSTTGGFVKLFQTRVLVVAELPLRHGQLGSTSQIRSIGIHDQEFQKFGLDGFTNGRVSDFEPDKGVVLAQDLDKSSGPSVVKIVALQVQCSQVLVARQCGCQASHPAIIEIVAIQVQIQQRFIVRQGVSNDTCPLIAHLVATQVETLQRASRFQ
jgi:hypothetical protein